MSQLIMPGAQHDIQRRSLDIICAHFTTSSQRYFASTNVSLIVLSIVVCTLLYRWYSYYTIIYCIVYMSGCQHRLLLQITDTLTLLSSLNQLLQYKRLLVDNKVSAILLITVIVQSVGSDYHDNIIEARLHQCVT